VFLNTTNTNAAQLPVTAGAIAHTVAPAHSRSVSSWGIGIVGSIRVLRSVPQVQPLRLRMDL
jgi:hypothetical protein